MPTLCSRHPGVPTTDLCVGCGESLCGQCAFVAADRRVFCPACKERLPPEERVPPPPATGATPGPAPGPRRQPDALPAVVVLPASEVPSPLAQIARSSPLGLISMTLGVVGFLFYPAAFLGAALGAQELRRHYTGLAPSPLWVGVAAFGVNALALLLRIVLWNGH